MPDYQTLPDVLRQALDGDEPVQTISLPTGDVAPVELSNFSTIGSHSYVDSDTPTLLIPSAPPVWRVRLPVTPQPDTGHGLIDGNALKSPHCPLESAVQAASILSSSTVDFSSIDFVLDRNSLRKLFALVMNEDKAFRIDGELLGEKTVMLTRSDADVWEKHDGFRGYAESFLTSQTTRVKGLELGAFRGAYWRVSKYDLGPFTFLVRYETDAQTSVQARSDASVASPVKVPDLADLLAATRLSDSGPFTIHHFPSPSPLSYHLTDTLIPPQSSLIKVKTRGSHKPIDPTEYWDQLFFSQTQHLWVAPYKRNGFFPPELFRKYELTKGELAEYGATTGMDAVARVVNILEAMKAAVLREGREGWGVSFISEPEVEGLQVWKTRDGHRRRSVGEEVKALFA